MRRLVTSKKILFILAAVVGLALLSLQLQGETQLTLKGADTASLVAFGSIAITLQMIGHWLRAVKHRYLLEQIRSIRTLEVFKGQMIGLLFNTVFPFRLGELVRAHYIGKGVSISRSAVFATIIFERWLDSVILLVIALFLLFTTATTPSSLLYAVAVLATAVVLLGSILYTARTQQPRLLRGIHAFSRIFNAHLRNGIRMMSWSAIYCIKNVINAQRLPRYLLLTVLMWLFYVASTAILIIGLVSTVPFTRQLVSAIAAYLGVSIPSGPAYIGTFQEVFSNISELSSSVLASTHLSSYLWLLLIAPTTLLGLCYLFLRQRLYHNEQSDALDVLRNKLYRDADITKEFAHFLDAYFKGDQINRILTTQELANNFQVLKTFKGGSNALTLLAWQNNTMVVKKITLRQYESKLRDQYLWLNERERLPSVARALQEERNKDYYAIDIEYRDNYIPFFDFIHSSSITESKKILRNVCDFVDAQIYTPKLEVKSPRRLLNEYISTKAVGKITDAANANLPMARLLAYDTLVVNGREIQNFSGIIEIITHHKQAMSDLTEIVKCPIQGDLTVDNVIVDPATNEFIILDPNNENAISDPVVDFGKLMQSVHSGYEFLYSLPSCSINENKVNFEERRSVQYDELYKELSNHLKKQLTSGRYRAVLFHEAIHYCRMLTYRVNINPDTAAAFYCIAVRLFNDFMEQYDKDAPKN
jgi:uncharacterized protein (TIRG00374 family)